MSKKELLAEIHELREKVMDQGRTIVAMILEAERCKERLQAAVEDMRKLGHMGQNVCPVCAYYNHGEGYKDKCIDCIINKEVDNFRWRGERTDGGADA